MRIWRKLWEWNGSKVFRAHEDLQMRKRRVKTDKKGDTECTEWNSAWEVFSDSKRKRYFPVTGWLLNRRCIAWNDKDNYVFNAGYCSRGEDKAKIDSRADLPDGMVCLAKQKNWKQQWWRIQSWIFIWIGYLGFWETVYTPYMTEKSGKAGNLPFRKNYHLVYVPQCR